MVPVIFQASVVHKTVAYFPRNVTAGIFQVDCRQADGGTINVRKNREKECKRSEISLFSA